MKQNRKLFVSLPKLLSSFILIKLATSYLEPGSSSFLLKILISSLVALVVFFRQIWSYVQVVWGKLSGKQPKPVELETAVSEQSAQNEIQ